MDRFTQQNHVDPKKTRPFQRFFFRLPATSFFAEMYEFLGLQLEDPRVKLKLKLNKLGLCSSVVSPTFVCSGFACLEVGFQCN